jgi:YbgC/YbaW family acyl-CoA thioester hydrolase
MPALSPINSFQTQRTVRFVDTDCSGSVHAGALIRMMEETEYAFLRSRNLSVVLSDEKGILGFPRLSASIDLHQSASFDEDLLVELNLLEIDGKQIVYQFEITLLTGQQVASGNFRVACCRFPNGKPPYAILTPAHIVEALTN